uniref:Uncharacterized protein n=2 Tax=Oryza glaberrima TaxID=4538 RepID=I1PZY2_ORYGL
MEWTAAEMDEARSIVARLTNAYDSGTLVAGAGNGDTRHDRIVRELQAWLPWRTMDQLIGLYIELMAEEPAAAQPQYFDAGAVVDPTFDFFNDHNNFLGMPPPPVQQADDHNMNNVVADASMNYYYGGGGAGGAMVFGGAPMGETVEQAAPPAPAPVPVVPVVMNRDDDEVNNQGGGRHRAAPTNTTRRFWTTEEHRQFLRGLRVYGRGEWKSISMNFVRSKTPVQVSSHAQKYFRRVESAAADKQRYSINDVGLNDDDDDDSAMDGTNIYSNNKFNNNFGGWQSLAFAGGHLEPVSGGAAPRQVIAPASSSAAAMNSAAQFWAPMLFNPQIQQQFMQMQAQTQQAWNDQHMMMAAAPMEGATDTNFEPAGAANYYYQQQQQEEEGGAYGVPADQWMMNQNNNMF